MIVSDFRLTARQYFGKHKISFGEQFNFVMQVCFSGNASGSRNPLIFVFANCSLKIYQFPRNIYVYILIYEKSILISLIENCHNIVDK